MSNTHENSCLINTNLESNKIQFNNSINDFSNENELILLFRNQLSSDTIIKLNKSKLNSLKISDVIELLYSKLNESKLDSHIRLFFKGRPLKEEEQLKDLCKQIFNFENNIFKYSFYKL
jgi:hypothetical protein